jgi:hypothetical protein
MSVLCHQVDELTEFAEDAGIPLTGRAVAVEEESPQVRRDKILAIRLQLAHGRYDLDAHLDELLEHLLTVLCA